MTHQSSPLEYIWVKPRDAVNEFTVPYAALILREDKSKIYVKDQKGKQYWINSSDVVKRMHSTSQNGVDDMITLGDLQEYAILHNLEMRYQQNKIYTYTGTMLIAINPYKILPIYTHREIKEYRGKKIHEMPPHIFAISDNAYQEMKRERTNHCIVISGESGAGKTESTKLILQYLAGLSGKHSWIEQQIIEANPILEAFGNAKTVRNDNSSRFGKYIEIRFTESGNIHNAKIEEYLLEKSRIVFQSPDERNYHIFYCLVAGLSKQERQDLNLLEDNPNKYHYLAQGECTVIKGKNDSADFMMIKSAMEVLSFKSDEILNIFSLLASILHLGNLNFKATTIQNMDTCEVNNQPEVNRICHLLSVSKEQLCTALVQKTILVHGEQVIIRLSKEAAIEGRDAFAKALYGNIFVKIVQRINATINKDERTALNTIGVLDIFGFENFQDNSFEQLCINYANENLQQFFVRHIFKMEQSEYQNEGIKWQHIEYQDNQETLDMIGMKHVNIMSLIDEESIFPKGTDQTLLEKLHVQHGNRSLYIKPKSNQENNFGVRHYAGIVFYNTRGFLEKNRDSFSLDLKEMIANSKNKFVKNIFPQMSLNDTMKKQLTLSLKFRNSLDLLIRTLTAAHPFFIRCVKPNELKQSNIFDRDLCVRQLRYSGMMETARIRQAGYSIRHDYPDFAERYSLLLSDKKSLKKLNSQQITQEICKTILPPKSDYQLGHTKLFLKDIDDTYLATKRSHIVLKSVLIIQRSFRRLLFRRFIIKHRLAAIKIQRAWRVYRQRKAFQIMHQGFQRLVACIKARQVKSQYITLRNYMIRLQAHCRGYLKRKEFYDQLSEKSNKMKELRMLRAKDEQHYLKTGQDNWKQKAEENHKKHLKAVKPNAEQTLEIKIPEENNNNLIDVESSKKIVDSVFGFLDEADVSGPVGPNVKQKSRMLELQLGKNKIIPTKLLSRPVRKNNDIPPGGTIRLPKSNETKPNTSEFSFAKFAATYFNAGITAHYSQRPIKKSLLNHDLPMDEIAAQSIWIMILRFMGDLAEAKYEADSSGTIMQRLTQTLRKSTLQSKEFQEALASLGEMEHQRRLIRKTLKRKTKIPDVLRQASDRAVDLESYQQILNARTTNLDKLHFIIGHGILRANLRDEIFAQICKQLTKNPYRVSFAKGWILLSLCIGCFPPSSGFENYLRCFIQLGPALYAPYCENRLNRTLKNGSRTQPPSWLELQATRNKSIITLQVLLMDGGIKKLEVDSASTAEEAVNQLTDHIGLIDKFGFSLVLTLYDKVISLGSHSEHIMDAISHCEQYTKEQGENERKSPWKLYLRKEVFSPWYDPSKDSLAAHLIYKQIIRGISAGEYRCHSEKDIAMICALEYYAEYGSNIKREFLLKCLPDYLPKNLLLDGDKSLKFWANLITDTFSHNDYTKSLTSRLKAKEDICLYAHLNWPIMFSRFFEAILTKGCQLSKDNIVIAINSNGFYMLNENEDILGQFDYIEISKVTLERDVNNIVDILHLDLLQEQQVSFKCCEAQDIKDLLNFILENLKQRSTFAVAIEDVKPSALEDQNLSQLYLSPGDLIRLKSETKSLLRRNEQQCEWLEGECCNITGFFPSKSVIILATLTKPSDRILKLYKNYKKDDLNRKTLARNQTSKRTLNLYNLRSFAKDHFRPQLKLHNSSSSLHAIKAKDEDLWRHSRSLLKAPLLKNLQENRDLFDLAVVMFNNILKYMGDVPTGKQSSFTDLIFKPALKHDQLKDELYCQLMKQLTDNCIKYSEERGWDLMYLATGLLRPSAIVLKELLAFLRARSHILAAASLKRIKRISNKTQRKQPPFILEVEHIQQRFAKIYHKVHIPDGSAEAFEIDAFTRAFDLKHLIGERLKLKYLEGFTLFVRIGKRIFSIPDQEYMFDYLYELMLWIKDTMPARNVDSKRNVSSYQLYFMKKLWINLQLGKDPNADIFFHYPQEKAKYLAGYYKISYDKALKIGCLIYYVNCGADITKALQKPQEILTQLIPQDLIPLMKPNEWKTQLINQFKNLTTTTNLEKDLIKLQFLRYLAEQEMFGSTFFRVKQTNDSSLPEYIVLAVNRKGFHIVDASTKNTLQSFEFKELNFWSSGNTFFNIHIGNLLGSNKLLYITDQSYKIDDLLSSYINYLNIH
uniref:Myosin motor domain-containing protein n=1 Tax=Glossina brevipalpis TaxID=37001 RepID=A0A1A9W1S0_9MUSC